MGYWGCVARPGIHWTHTGCTRPIGWQSAKMVGSLALLVAIGCGTSSEPGGTSEDAAPDRTADSATIDVSIAKDSTVVDAFDETTSNDGDSASDASFEAASHETSTADAAPASDAADGEAAAVCQPVDASTPDPGAVAAGLALVANRTCSLCHGGAFSGGIAVPSINGGSAYSKNLTPDPATGLGCWTDEQIVTVILDGVTPEGDTLCVMPKWRNMPLQGKSPLSPAEAGQIVQYLRTLTPVHNDVRPSDCVALGYPKPDAAVEASTPDASDAAIE